MWKINNIEIALYTNILEITRNYYGILYSKRCSEYLVTTLKLGYTKAILQIGIVNLLKPGRTRLTPYIFLQIIKLNTLFVIIPPPLRYFGFYGMVFGWPLGCFLCRWELFFVVVFVGFWTLQNLSVLSVPFLYPHRMYSL